MGLDMYLEGRKWSPSKPDKEDGFPVKTKTLDLGYWRKHPNLHGYIVQAFAEGRDECQEIRLSAQDIRNIISTLERNNLPHTTGFFFGVSENSEMRRQADIDVFRNALAWLEAVPVAPKLEEVEMDPAAPFKMFSVPLDNLPDEYRAVIYQASW